MSTASCIYEGTIRHRRRDPDRSFEHSIALFYLDLDEVPRLLGPRFHRRDYLGDPRVPLDEAVREVTERHIGSRPGGPIRVLTQLRAFGRAFNPVSFYYCFDPAGEKVEAIVAEVTNTPWGERHAYVIPGRAAELDKALHVSPFMAMDQRYLVRAGTPGDRLGVHIEARRGGSITFDATLALRRRELTRRAGRPSLANLRVLALIYRHALGLKLAGARFYRHPRSIERREAA